MLTTYINCCCYWFGFAIVTLRRESMCKRSFVAKNAILVSNDYPTYLYNPQCVAHIFAEPDSIIKAYVLDMSIK